jgi:hypothetical protein
VASRAASTVLSNTVQEESKNDLDAHAVARYFDRDLSIRSLHENLTIPESKSVNVTVHISTGARRARRTRSGSRPATPTTTSPRPR